MAPAWAYCSQAEGFERQRAKEISKFEVNEKGLLDPCLAVAKYRRSAAGSSDRYPPRSLEQLQNTVDHLLCRVFAQHFGSDLKEVVFFINDRLRAIQSELIKQRYNDPLSLYKSLRYVIFTNYLMTNVYDVSELKHHENLLQNTLSLLLDSLLVKIDDDSVHQELCDEALAYKFLYHFVSECAGMSTLMRFVKNGHKSSFRITSSALYLVFAYESGNYYQFWNLLQGHESWKIIFRCIVAPIFMQVRITSMKCLSKGWMKGERVSIFDLSRILNLNLLDVEKFCLSLGFAIDDDRVMFQKLPVIENQVFSPDDFSFIVGTKRIMVDKKFVTDLLKV